VCVCERERERVVMDIRVYIIRQRDSVCVCREPSKGESERVCECVYV